LETAEETVRCKEQEGAADVANWEWLKSVIVELGWDGMSSEESENEDDIETVYRPKILPWRRDMENELELIDNEYRRLAKTKARRGPTPAPRRRGAGNTISTRDPVCGLPACLYKESWLAKQSDNYAERILQISLKKFKWKNLRTSTG
jgi:hypothetical protein